MAVACEKARAASPPAAAALVSAVAVAAALADAAPLRALARTDDTAAALACRVGTGGGHGGEGGR
jgi:hypothetical protein